MKLSDFQLIFIAAGLIGVLLIASPALASLIHLPSGEAFSELYLLGPNNMAGDYPFNIEVGQNYLVYVGVGNNLGSSAYYVIEVKLLNGTSLLPDSSAGTPSPAQSLYEYRFVLQDGATWEAPLNFSIVDGSISGLNSQINVLQINDVTFTVGTSALWNSNSTVFNYQLLFELWLYNNSSGAVDYNNRFVDLQLNFTGPT